ncbi:hypothetical protein BM221_001785 [Beauveria bassiana]|uniref:Uncharacterized protein n=1 Tax=Beauveria bassiana TaxID=176275 RepID=A0A2N6NWN5_BEABA|nr:hypothetical protein BM221_001785 [Beauveria bassiana]
MCDRIKREFNPDNVAVALDKMSLKDDEAALVQTTQLASVLIIVVLCSFVAKSSRSANILGNVQKTATLAESKSRKG